MNIYVIKLKYRFLATLTSKKFEKTVKWVWWIKWVFCLRYWALFFVFFYATPVERDPLNPPNPLESKKGALTTNKKKNGTQE